MCVGSAAALASPSSASTARRRNAASDILLGALSFLFASVLASAHAEPSACTNADAIAQVEQIIQTFQKSIIDKDAATLGALFLPDHNSWLTVLDDAMYGLVKAKHPEATKLRPGTYREFVDFVGTSKTAIEEKFSNVRINTNGNVAAVYFDFVFLSNGAVNNRGSESWHLVKTENGWKINSMIYSIDR